MVYDKTFFKFIKPRTHLSVTSFDAAKFTNNWWNGVTAYLTENVTSVYAAS